MVNPMERRMDGVRQLTPADLQGSPGKPMSEGAFGHFATDGKVDLPMVGYENPGPTANLRGIEPNTDWGRGSDSEPMIQVVTAGEPPQSAVLSPQWHVPDDSKGDVVGDAPDGWQTSDSAHNNFLMPDWPQVSSWTKFGEKYPGSDVMNDV